MKKSRKHKTRKQKNRKHKTRKQKGGDACEKSNILEKLDESLVKYEELIDSLKLATQGKGFNAKLDQDSVVEENEIINNLCDEIKKCDNIKDLINLIKRRKYMSIYSSNKREFYKNLLEKIESYIEGDEEKIIRELSKSLEAYKKSKSTKIRKIHPMENGIITLNGTITNYDKDTITDIIKKQNRFSFLDSDKKEFYEKILEKLDSQDSQNGQQDGSQGSQTDLSIEYS